MAKLVEQLILGADVSQQWIDLYDHQSQRSERIDNTVAGIEGALGGLAGPVRVAVEATNTFHEGLVQAAWAAGMEVYLIDGYQLSHYREALRQRAKTDAADAQLLARFLANEGAQLKPFRAPTAEQQRLWRLLKRRATLIKTQKQLRLSLSDVEELQGALQALIGQIHQLVRRIDRRLKALAQALGWSPLIGLCTSIPGVGFLSALALLATFQRAHFTRDAFIAFMGLDVQVRDSGKHRGKRKLTKKGDPEIRRLLLYCAAMAAARTTAFKPHYVALRARGLSTTAAHVAIARKLARLAFVLLHNNTQFDPHKLNPPCVAT